MIRDKIKKIAFIYEGVKTEANLFENIQNHFFRGKAEVHVVALPADGNIYMLWNRLREDEFQTDVISVLKEMNREAAEILKDCSADDFSEIYLFFDYDGHNDNIPSEFRNTDVLDAMLSVFDNETDLGKLYISYPMIESIKEISMNEQDYRTFYLPLEDCGVYKQIVGRKSDYEDFRYITKEMWYAACNASRKRASLMVSFSDQCDYEVFISKVTQYEIYKSQKVNFIRNNKMIGILNGVPLFLIEYYDERFWRIICEQDTSCLSLHFPV